jgi:putative transposase
MDFMRCKSPPMVNTEFWMKLLAYNLIRMTAGVAAKQELILPREISFVSTCQYILSNWDLACFSTLYPDECIRQILRCISQCRVGRRPDRFEPRCVKRRRDQYTLMMELRDELRQRLSKGDNSFE